MKYKSLFSYYGGKSKLAHLYPPPKHDLIIEPFGGAASYALRYHDRDVWVNDLDERTYSIWEFLLSDGALDLIETIPDDPKVGDNVDEMVPDGSPTGFLELLRAEANRGSQGTNGKRKLITSMAINSGCWKRIKPKHRELIPKIRHWKISRIDYRFLPNETATWFIDPPYKNAAGNRYRTNTVNFDDLKDWILSRRGQKIVCENEGADWLPFQLLRRGRDGVHSMYQKSQIGEVFCEVLK